jgi:hypothetical protein
LASTFEGLDEIEDNVRFLVDELSLGGGEVEGAGEPLRVVSQGGQGSGNRFDLDEDVLLIRSRRL